MSVTILAIVGLGLLFALMTVKIAVDLSEFKKELSYLNGEISRCSGNERKYYKRLRRRLWLSLIPFVKYR